MLVLGAALQPGIYITIKNVTAKDRDLMRGAYLGPEFTDIEIEAELTACAARFKKLTETELIEEVASELADERVVGWMQGRMEFGPRALGGRSIIADPRSLVAKAA